MIDIEFLTRRPRLDDAVVVYRYRDGALRAAMKRVIPKVLAGQGITCEAAEPEQLTAGAGSLFSDEGARLCDLRERVWVEKEERFHDYDAFHAGLRDRRHDVTVVLVPDDSPFFVCPAWSELQPTCRLIEEVAVRTDTLAPLLRCLVRISDLEPAADLADQPGFLASFDDLFDRAPPDLSDVVAAFESRVLTRTDPITGRFDAAGYRRGSETDLSPLRERVSALLIERDGWAAVELARALDARRWARVRPAVSTVRDLVWATARLLADPARPGRAGARPRPRDIAVWATALLGWEDRLAGRTAPGRPEGLTAGADRLGRDVVRRLALPGSADPIAGLWRPLDGPLQAFASAQESPLANARARLIRHLHAVVSAEAARTAPPWITRLHARLVEAVRDADRLAAAQDAR